MPPTRSIVTVEYLSSQEIVIQNQSTMSKSSASEDNSNDLGHAISKDQVDAETVGDFGQRVRVSSLVRHRNEENLGQVRSRQPLDSPPSIENYRKQHRKNVRASALKKPSVSESTLNAFSEDKLSSSAPKAAEPQRKEADEDHSTADYLQHKVKSTSVWKSDGNGSQAAGREIKARKTEQDNIIAVKDSASTTVATLTVSLGKFSGPIVVPDLPRQKKYTYATASDHLNSNEVPRSTAATVESTTKSKGSDSGYLAASPFILNPLQVGVALMNAAQDLNSVNDAIALPRDYPPDEVQASNNGTPNNESVVQNDASYSDGSSLQNDQVSQQEQISEVVAPNSPAQSVEIQKSVEIFHTAPIQEIHYPVEYVPHQPPARQRPSESDFRKQQKERRPGQVNIYKSNEIVDEIAPSSNQERGRYEYNVNENDVVYSATNDQVDPVVVRPLDNKPIFGAREQLDGVQFDQSIGKHSRVQGNSDILKEVKQIDFELAKGPALVTQPSRVVEALPGVPNPENLQEVPQILLTKAANEPQTELRLLMTVPQPYPVEKVVEKTVHIPHAIDVVEKVPYPVEKVIEKQITIPQPFPVHVPIDRVVEKQVRVPYPVHVEKVIEKVPYAIQRFIIPFPIHFRVPQPISIPVEKVVEKPVPIPVPVEKIVEKTVHPPRPYPLDTTKLIKSVTIPIYNVQNDGSFQQTRQQSLQNFQTSSGPSYGADNQGGYFNATQFYGLGYAALNRPHARQPLIHVLPKKFGSFGVQYPHSAAAYSALVSNNGNSVSYGKTLEDKVKDEYVGPVPRKVLQATLGMQSKSLQYTSPDIQATLRRTRQEGGNTGSFRQSKMEYGFKPPMVPSVQYDEQSASKVE